MTTNLLSVIDQLVGALINLDKVWRESNESYLGLQGEKNNSFYTLEDTTAALAAGKQALEQVQGEAVGWKLVPVEPTKAMRRVGADVWSKVGGSFTQVTGAMYRAMLAVAPTHPQATEPVAEHCEHGVRWDSVCRACDELPATEPAPKRPINCGTGHCSCVECVMEPAPSTAGEAALGRATALNEMSLAQIQVLRDVSDEYNAWIRFHASVGDYDDFLKQYGAFK